jgi:hypothetical protein
MTSGTSSLVSDGPRLRLLPLPVTEPPYDDDDAGQPVHDPLHRHRQPALALSFVLPSGLPATPPVPRLRVVSGAGGVAAHAGARHAGARMTAVAADPDGEDAALDFAPQPTPRELLPEPRRWAARLVQALVEVLAGDRPAGQLIRWTNEDVYTTVQRRSSLRLRRPDRRVGPRAVVRSVRVSEPADGVVEACAMVQRGLRSTAVAVRLEGIDGRWQCTALELG